MLWAMVKTFRRFPLFTVRLTTDTQTAVRKTPLVFVGNNAYEVSLPNAGGRAVLDRGELGPYVVGCRSRWGLLRMAARAALGRLDQGRDLEMRSAAEAEIRSRMRRPLRVSIDGEVAAMRPPLRYRIRPGALSVLAPEPR